MSIEVIQILKLRSQATLLCPESPACHYGLVFPHHSCRQTRTSESGRWSSSRMQRRMCWWPQMWHPKVWTFLTFSMSLTTTCLKTLRTTVSEGGFVIRLSPLPNRVTAHREKFEEIQNLWTPWGVAVIFFLSAQSQFIEKGFKKAENFEFRVVLLLFLFTCDIFKLKDI